MVDPEDISCLNGTITLVFQTDELKFGLHTFHLLQAGDLGIDDPDLMFQFIDRDVLRHNDVLYV